MRHSDGGQRLASQSATSNARDSCTAIALPPGRTKDEFWGVTIQWSALKVVLNRVFAPNRNPNPPSNARSSVRRETHVVGETGRMNGYRLNSPRAATNKRGVRV